MKILTKPHVQKCFPRKSHRNIVQRKLYVADFGAASKWRDESVVKWQVEIGLVMEEIRKGNVTGDVMELKKEEDVERWNEYMRDDVAEFHKSWKESAKECYASSLAYKPCEWSTLEKACLSLMQWVDGLKVSLQLLSPLRTSVLADAKQIWRNDMKKIGKRFLEVGLFLCRMTDDGPEDEFYHHAHAIELLLEDFDDNKEGKSYMAKRIVEKYGPAESEHYLEYDQTVDMTPIGYYDNEDELGARQSRLESVQYLVEGHWGVEAEEGVKTTKKRRLEM
jgi:hypothetical protein